MKQSPGNRRRMKLSPMPDTLLAAALRAQSEGVFIAEVGRSSDGLRIVFVNESFCAMTGHEARELIGQSHGLLHADRKEVGRLQRWLRMARRGEPLVGEGFLVRGDGALVSAAWSFDPLGDEEGRVTHVVATYRDQTEKRRLQDALVHAQRLDAVGRLAGGVAHDFNNLLSVINGYCEILAAQVAANPQAMREVAEIHHAGRKAAALTRQLLAFSRRQPFHARVLNLSALVRENGAILQRLLGRAGELRLELSAELANVRTDATQFQQVVLNLVLNARDALRANGCIVVSTANRMIDAAQSRRSPELPRGRYVALTISDNGSGMDAETKKHLFEPFFTTKPEGKGTGLGLALVYGVVQQSGGFISVQSEVRVGSTFEILLPTVSEPLDELPPSVAPLPSLRGTESVVLIEDDDVVCKMVAGILTTDGYRVTAGKTLADWERQQGKKAGVVHLLIMPMGGDGEKGARRLLRKNRDMRLLCMGHAGAKRPVTWLAPERQRCIHKPFALSELLGTARRLLDA